MCKNAKKNGMKRISKIWLSLVLALTLSATKADAQVQYLGIKGGWGMSDIRLYPYWDSPPAWGKLSGGISWTYYGGGKSSAYLYDDYTGGVCVELELMQRGFQYAALDRNSKRFTYGREFNALVLPVMWQPHYIGLDGRLRLFLNAGATLAYNLDAGSKEFYIDNETGLREEFDYEWLTVRDNRFTYGLVVGLGAGMTFGNIEVMMEGRYYFGYSDITKRKTIYQGTQFLRSPMDHINLSVGVSYRWNHSGSWSWSPATRKAKKAAQVEVLPGDEFIVEDGVVTEIVEQ